MTELDLKEIERELEFAKLNKRGFFYINKDTVLAMTQEIRRLQIIGNKYITKEDYLVMINQKLDLILKVIDNNNY